MKTSKNRWIFTVLAGCLLGGSFFSPLKGLQAAPAPAPVAQEAKVVNINKADASQFESLKGIGPMLAERIIQYREAHGPFKNIEDLVGVPGIGPAKLEKLKTQLTI